jgi:Ca-activated chloride channel family protein
MMGRVRRNSAEERNVRLSSWIGVVAALASLAAGPRPADQRPAFRSGVDLVSVNVTVTDRQGDFVTTLNADDFQIFEDGKEQTITFFLPGGQRRLDDPDHPTELHLGVLLDISGSMEVDIKQEQDAAVKFLTTLDGADDITLVAFDTEVRVTRFSPLDFPRLVERIRNRRPEGWTALYDALGVYLDNASFEQGRKILVLYTDGDDTRSEIRFSDVRDLLRASDVTVYTIGFLEHVSYSRRASALVELKEIAEITGGQFFDPTSKKDLESSYDKVKAEIDAQYAIGYVSSNSRTDGAWRKVEVKVVGENRKDLRLRSRKGYFAPYRPGGEAGPAVPASVRIDFRR